MSYDDDGRSVTSGDVGGLAEVSPGLAAVCGPGASARQGSKKRASYLTVEQQRRLQHWGRNLNSMFNPKVPRRYERHVVAYQVGSSIQRPDWRDVDVRVILDDKAYAALAKVTNVLDLNMLLSAWGREQTGLPIDCQVQSMTDANSGDHPGRRHPLGMI